MKILITIIALATPFVVSANLEQTLDKKIERFCMTHEKANLTSYGARGEEIKMWKRCSLILQAQYRYETNSCENLQSTARVNNCFGFRGGLRSEWTKKYGATLNSNRDLVFPDKTNSIKFAVDRFYKYDLYKPISIIIRGGYYYSPKKGHIRGLPFAITTEKRYQNYVGFVRNYFLSNL